MEDKGTFSPVGMSQERLYGPRGIVACGMTEQDKVRLTDMIGQVQDLAVVFVDDRLADHCLVDILNREPEGATTHEAVQPTMARAIIMSGVTEQELHWLMAAYRGLGLPRPLWATLTPHSAGWTVRKLVTELAAEDAAFRSQRSPSA